MARSKGNKGKKGAGRGSGKDTPGDGGKSTRFRPGKSGNPKGRPKGARNMSTVLDAELSERMEVREQGKVRKISKLEGAVKTNVAKAVMGDARHTTILMNNMHKMEAAKQLHEATFSEKRRTEILHRFLARMRAHFFAEFQRNQNTGDIDETEA